MPAPTRYCLGFFIGEPDVVFLGGQDAGVSLYSQYDRATGEILTLLSNTTNGAWPMLANLKPS